MERINNNILNEVNKGWIYLSQKQLFDNKLSNLPTLLLNRQRENSSQLFFIKSLESFLEKSRSSIIANFN